MKLSALSALPLVGAVCCTTLFPEEHARTALATSDQPATVAIEESAPFDRSFGDVVYLTLELKTLREDVESPFALDVSVLPCENCDVGEGVYRLGPLSIFPAPRVGETRVVDIALETASFPRSAEYVSVALKPLVEDRPVANGAVEVLSAKLRAGNS